MVDAGPHVGLEQELLLWCGPQVHAVKQEASQVIRGPPERGVRGRAPAIHKDEPSRGGGGQDEDVPREEVAMDEAQRVHAADLSAQLSREAAPAPLIGARQGPIFVPVVEALRRTAQGRVQLLHARELFEDGPRPENG